MLRIHPSNGIEWKRFVYFSEEWRCRAEDLSLIFTTSPDDHRVPPLYPLRINSTALNNDVMDEYCVVVGAGSDVNSKTQSKQQWVSDTIINTVLAILSVHTAALGTFPSGIMMLGIYVTCIGNQKPSRLRASDQ
ncbi:hypothetical protein J6590_034836 [Homalodisca vitripennis]|nr:hypothetical protein J6590_034836 [Homalodisca vitripennis]